MGKQRQILKKQTVDATSYEMALKRINHVYDVFDHVAVSFSGGKDSTVALHLTLQVAREREKLPLRAIFFDEEAIAYEIEDYVRRVAERDEIDLEWYCVPVKHRNAGSKDAPVWYPWAPEKKDLWVREMPPEVITEIKGYGPDVYENEEKRIPLPAVNGLLFPPDQYGKSAIMLGIRAVESHIRQSAVSRRVRENYIIKHNSTYGDFDVINFGNLYKAYPIYDFTTEDIWTAINQNEWDYSEFYDLIEMAGVSHHNQRVAPPFGQEPIQNLFTYRSCFPDLWAKMVKRVPGANMGARWARTELFSYGGRMKPPEGKTWKAHIIDMIKEKWDEKDQAKVASQVEQIMKMHDRKTGGDPIMPTAPHPESGVSWSFLFHIVHRGDFKGRLDPRKHVRDRDFDELMTNYQAQLEEMRNEQSYGESS